MFLFSGALASLVEPPVQTGLRTDGPPEVPEQVLRALRASPMAGGQPAALGDTALLLDRQESGFLMLENRLGCLVAHGDPVVDGSGTVRLVQDFLALAHAGGRVPLIRNARRRTLPLYRSLGLRGEVSHEVPVLGLDRLDRYAASLRRTLGRASDRGTDVDVLPSEWVEPALPELREAFPELDPAPLRQGPIAVLRHRGRIVAVASLWTAAPGGEAQIGELHVASSAPKRWADTLLAGVLLWAGRQGFSRLLATGLPLRHQDHALGEVPVRWEPRYTVRPRGVNGLWASLVARYFTQGSQLR